MTAQEGSRSKEGGLRFSLSALQPGSSRRGLTRPRAMGFATVTLSKQSTATPVAASDRKVAMKPASDVLAGAVARAASQSTIHPLDTLKVRMQAGTAGISKIGRLVPPSGTVNWSNLVAPVASLYRGVAGAATGAGIALGAYFACYGVATNALLKHTELPSSSVAFCAGGLAAAGSSVVKVPLAVCIRSVQANVYPNFFAAAGQITQATGVKGLFTGFTPTLLEDVPDMAFKFAAYESLRQLHSRLNGGRKANATEDFAMGAVAGAFAAAATTPLDVIKTNMMCNASSSPNMFSAARAVYAEAGWAGFARGIGPRAVSNGINSAVFFCFFEAIRGYFARQAQAAQERQEARRVAQEAALTLARPLPAAKPAAAATAAAEGFEDDWQEDCAPQVKPVGASMSLSATKTRFSLLSVNRLGSQEPGEVA